MISKAATVEGFLVAQSPADRAVFSKIRSLLRKSHPKIVESMKWRMPTYEIDGDYFGAFNRQKNYLCLYINPAALEPYRKELESSGLDCGKSCIRFRKPGDLPVDVAAKIIKRAAALAQRRR